MAEFSNTQEYDDPCLACEDGNLFHLDMTQEMADKLQVRGFVNSKNTPTLPANETYTLINSANETTGKCMLEVGGEKVTIFENIGDFGSVATPSDMRFYLGARSTSPESYKGYGSEYSIQNTAQTSDEEIIFTLKIPPELSLPVGDVNLESLSPAKERQFSSVLGIMFDVDFDRIDKFLESWYFKAAQEGIPGLIGGGIALQGSYEDLFPDQLRNNPQVMQRLRKDFLHLLFRTKVGKVFMANGERMISFRGLARHAKFLNGTYFPASSLRFLNLDVKGTATATIWDETKGAFKGGLTRIVIFIGAGIEFYQWMREETEDFADLIGRIGKLVLTAAITGAIVGALKAGIVALLTLLGVAVSLPTIVVGAIAIFGAFAIGWVVGEVLDYFGVKDDIARFFRKYFSGTSGQQVDLFDNMELADQMPSAGEWIRVRQDDGMLRQASDYPIDMIQGLTRP